MCLQSFQFTAAPLQLRTFSSLAFLFTPSPHLRRGRTSCFTGHRSSRFDTLLFQTSFSHTSPKTRRNILLSKTASRVLSDFDSLYVSALYHSTLLITVLYISNFDLFDKIVELSAFLLQCSAVFTKKIRRPTSAEVLSLFVRVEPR